MVCFPLQYMTIVKKLLLFRDGLVKSPYINTLMEKFIFASEIKCLLDFVDVKINEKYFPMLL